MTMTTLGDALDAGWRLRAKCEGVTYIDTKLFGGCNEKVELDMRTPVWTRGAASKLTQLPERLKCPKCGSQRMRLVYEVPTEPNAATMQVKSSLE
jgi:hypothetical protein